MSDQYCGNSEAGTAKMEIVKPTNSQEELTQQKREEIIYFAILKHSILGLHKLISKSFLNL